MKYKIIQEDSQTRLEIVINKYLQLGWELQAGVSISALAHNYIIYAQAIVRQEEEQE